MSYVQNYGVYRGSAVSITFTCDEAITDWTLGFVLSATEGGAATVSLASGSGITTTDGPGGVCVVTLSSANLTVAAGTYYYVLRRTDAGSEAVLAEGRFVVALPSAV